MKKRLFALTACVLMLALCFAACGTGAASPSAAPQPSAVASPEAAAEAVLTVTNAAGVAKAFTLDELKALPASEAVYSVINNWPTQKFCVARGVKVSDILEAAGAAEGNTYTFASDDGYFTALTRAQYTAERFCYPGLLENDAAGATPVDMIVAYEFADDADDLAKLAECPPMLVFGQSYIAEHNTVAFVEKLSTITASSAPCEKWENPQTYPAEGAIAAGETVKLTHPTLGILKLFYTLDGSEPTLESAMYNPSTYQPELNAPIPITRDVTIKVYASGYGKEDSDVVTFNFKVK